METKELRELLNNFFQDIDTEAKIDSDQANAIIDVHLHKFEKLISLAKEEMGKGIEEEFVKLLPAIPTVKNKKLTSQGFFWWRNFLKPAIKTYLERKL